MAVAVLVMPPCRRRSSGEDSAGVNPRECMRCLGLSKRGRSPRAATVVTATVNGPPRSAWSADDARGEPPGLPVVCDACSRRGRRSGWSVIARMYSWQTIGCAGVGQTTAESHRRWAGPQVAWPVERVLLPQEKRCQPKLRAAEERGWPARPRHRSRMASSSTVGTETGVNPERIRRAS